MIVDEEEDKFHFDIVIPPPIKQVVGRPMRFTLSTSQIHLRDEHTLGELLASQLKTYNKSVHTASYQRNSKTDSGIITLCTIKSKTLPELRSIIHDTTSKMLNELANMKSSFVEACKPENLKKTDNTLFNAGFNFDSEEHAHFKQFEEVPPTQVTDPSRNLLKLTFSNQEILDSENNKEESELPHDVVTLSGLNFFNPPQ